jgi:hypothetical protein
VCIVFAAAGFALSSYLALYQLGLVGPVWEPFFGLGAAEVLYSRAWRSLPLPESVVSAFGFFAAMAVSVVLGGDGRGRRRGLEILFVLVVGALCSFNLLVAIRKHQLFDAWCTLCLVSTGLSALIAVVAGRQLVSSSAQK